MLHSHRTFSHLLHDMSEQSFDDHQVGHAAWVARSVGRGATAPLHPDDLTALADHLESTSLPAGSVMFSADQPPDGVWIVGQGQVELSVGSGRQRAVVGALGPGDVDGDIALLLGAEPAYTARTLTEAQCLFLPQRNFDTLLTTHPEIARRWISSVAQRVSTGQARLTDLLGRPLPVQVAQLLLDEAVDGSVQPDQRTLAAMLGMRIASFHKVIEEFERHHLITIGPRSIDIEDVDGLRQLTAKTPSH
ncbi:Crp/Fnr family transcriptional regulator [Nocardia sp. NPDC127606]|uniref:Crp/Fnr family transcriptional regulator n=1 Tax=Nocardia sp. NPDC127606 TaxID=3345406 RepID=UPI0036424584